MKWRPFYLSWVGWLVGWLVAAEKSAESTSNLNVAANDKISHILI